MLSNTGDGYYNFDDIERILDVVLAFGSETRYENLLGIILTKMMEITNSDAGTLYIVEDGKLHFRIIRNVSLNIYKSSGLMRTKPHDETEADEINLPPIVLDKNNIDNVSAYAAINNEIVAIDDVYESQRFNFSGPKNYDKMTGYRTRSMLALPLTVSLEALDPNVLGVIQLINAKNRESGEVVPFGNIYDLPLIPALSQMASNSLGNLIHLREVRLLFRSFVAVLTQAIDERSTYNNYHTQNVSWYCNAFAKYLSKRFEPGHPFYFDSNRKDRITIAALLHDIGKIITPLYIMDKSDRLGPRLEAVRYRFEIKRLQLENDMLSGLISTKDFEAEASEIAESLEFIESVNKQSFLGDEQHAQVQTLAKLVYKNKLGETVPLLDDEDIEFLSIRKGTLSNDERVIMQDHVALTGRLLDQITSWKYYRDVPEWARNHHEFLDGSGYPRGLKGDELSIETCIITIVDIFEALTASDRPYKKAMPIDKSLKILDEMAEEGKLHKELVNLFTESKVWQDESKP